MKFGTGKKTSENPTKIDFGRVLVSIWKGFGAVFGLLGVLFAASWLIFERSKSSFFPALVQNGLQEGFWMDFGSLWEDFGRVWEDLRIRKWDPRAASLRPAERHNFK